MFSVVFEVQPRPEQWEFDGRLRRVRVVRDYGMFDRREAPQYYSGAVRTTA
jgi:hypothetical protein